MWWFILTFVGGLAVGRLVRLPAAFLRRVGQLVTPCLGVLVLVLGFQLGGRRDLIHQLPQIGWQSIVIAVCVTLASGAVAWLSAPLFTSRLHGPANLHGKGDSMDR